MTPPSPPPPEDDFVCPQMHNLYIQQEILWKYQDVKFCTGFLEKKCRTIIFRENMNYFCENNELISAKLLRKRSLLEDCRRTEVFQRFSQKGNLPNFKFSELSIFAKCQFRLHPNCILPRPLISFWASLQVGAHYQGACSYSSYCFVFSPSLPSLHLWLMDCHLLLLLLPLPKI